MVTITLLRDEEIFLDTELSLTADKLLRDLEVQGRRGSAEYYEYMKDQMFL